MKKEMSASPHDRVHETSASAVCGNRSSCLSGLMHLRKPAVKPGGENAGELKPMTNQHLLLLFSCWKQNKDKPSVIPGDKESKAAAGNH